MSNDDGERITFLDNFWLRQDRPYNHMTISSVMVLADRVELASLQQIFATRWCAYRRFKQRPVDHPTGVYWETDPHFDIGNHVRRIGLPGGQGKEELEELVSNLVTMPMDPTKPLWDIHVVDNYQGGSAVIWRIHHCYGDGIALIHAALSMTDKPPGGPVATTPHPARKSASQQDEAAGDIFRQLFEPVSEAIRQAVKAGRDLVEEGVDIALHPAETVDQARQGIGTVLSYARQGLGFVSEASRLLFLTDDPSTCFKGKLGVAKRVAWSDPLPVDDVKILGKALGATINDVLLSCVTGALRTYLLEQGEPVDSTLEIRAAVPVNLRPQGQADKLGNFFGMVLLPLPIGIENPLERLAAVHQRMDALRASYQAIVTIGVMEMLGLGPPLAQASAMRLLSKKATAVMTNVPGSPEPLYLAGHQITEWMFWVPQSGSVGMGVSIITYAGHVYFGLITDRKRVSDPETIISRFGKEFEKLVLITMMGPWDQHLDAEAMGDFIKTLEQPAYR
jgi:WS/DGAT/MGAT family acyltransferase